MLRIKLRNGHDHGFKIHDGFLRNVHQRRVAAHPGGSRRGVDGENALARIQEIGRVAGNLEGGKCAAFRVLRNRVKQFRGGIIENPDFSAVRRISGVKLLQHLDHHVVRGLVDERNQHLFPIQNEGAVRIFRRSRFRNLPDEIPGQGFRKGVAQGFHIVLIDVAGLRGTHVGNRIIMAADGAFLQKLGNDFRL